MVHFNANSIPDTSPKFKLPTQVSTAQPSTTSYMSRLSLTGLMAKTRHTRRELLVERCLIYLEETFNLVCHPLRTKQPFAKGTSQRRRKAVRLPKYPRQSLHPLPPLHLRLHRRLPGQDCPKTKRQTHPPPDLDHHCFEARPNPHQPSNL